MLSSFSSCIVVDWQLTNFCTACAALTKRVEAMEGLVSERDARITALEKALGEAEAKLAAKQAGA